MDELLAVTDLEVGFRTDRGLARVLDRVNFHVGRGEIVGLVGESGCGKTTLARAILGVLPANSAHISSGVIDFGGRNLLAESSWDLATEVRGRQITFVPQDPFSSFNPVFTIGAQIEELMKWKSPDAEPTTASRFYPRARRRADRARVLDLLRTVQLPDPEGILKKYPHEVSGGQRQRLMIAMALLPEPRLIIADEPTTALDVTIQAQILKLLKRLASERRVSVLFTTHDLGTAYEICDRVTVMYAGQEVESALSDDFFAAPRHPYTKRLLESLPSRERGIGGIPGQIPALIDPPTGCRFHPRCDRTGTRCAAVRPDVSEVGPAHLIRCHHPVEAVP
ncbi:MAG: ABC transporter ATP-binding protein [Alphaproteobacteria bacterium]|nr:ABC transporter ATP-binding protein [Alphaproteobacteria bacterium]